VERLIVLVQQAKNRGPQARSYEEGFSVVARRGVVVERMSVLAQQAKNRGSQSRSYEEGLSVVGASLRGAILISR
jgi:hypothetical protein